MIKSNDILRKQTALKVSHISTFLYWVYLELFCLLCLNGEWIDLWLDRYPFNHLIGQSVKYYGVKVCFVHMCHVEHV